MPDVTFILSGEGWPGLRCSPPEHERLPMRATAMAGDYIDSSRSPAGWRSWSSYMRQRKLERQTYVIALGDENDAVHGKECDQDSGGAGVERTGRMFGTTREVADNHRLEHGCQ